MKLAEALILRADNKKRFEQVKQRLLNNVKIQEGDKPSEKPEDLLKEMEQTAAEFEKLIKQINQTNSATEFSSGKTLTDALAERDTLALRGNAYRALVNTATQTETRYGRPKLNLSERLTRQRYKDKPMILPKSIVSLTRKFKN